MADTDRNEAFTELEATGVFTDPGGTEHTGSMGGSSLETQDGGTTTVSDTTVLNFGTDLGVTDDGGGTATVAFTGSGGSDTRFDAQNTDGTTLVGDVEAVTAGTDLSFTDDGDGSVTLDFDGESGSALETQDDGTSVTTDTTLMNFGTDLGVTDDGSGAVTVDFTGSGGTDTRFNAQNTDGTDLVTDVTAVTAGTDLAFSDDGDGSVTLDASVDTFSGSHTDLTDVSTDDHHTRFSDDANDSLADIPNRDHSALTGVGTDDHHAKYTDSEARTAVGGSTPWANADLENSSVTVAGNAVALGASTGIDHADLSAIGSDDHHTRFSDAAGDDLADIPNRDHSALTGVGSDDHHIRFGDDANDSLADIPNRAHSDLTGINADDHHTKYTDGEAQDAVGNNVGTGLSYDSGAGEVAFNVVASGVATLSSGAATISTGVTTAGSHIDVALDPSGDGANSADVKVAARAFWDNAAGEYKVELLEDGTSVGNPDVGYEVVSH